MRKERTPAPRRDLLAPIAAPGPRFLWGLALMPLAAFNDSWAVALGELCLAAVLAALSGKRLRPVANSVLLASIVAFSLLSPHGLVLARWGAFRVTRGALLDGIERGATILCLIYLSGASVSWGLRLPGRFGSLLAEVFAAFNRLMETRAAFDRRDWIASLDSALFRLLDPDASPGPEAADRAYARAAPSGAKAAAGIALYASTLAAAALALAFTRGWL